MVSEAIQGGAKLIGVMLEHLSKREIAQIELHTKPVILFNIDGYYDALLQYFERVITDRFVREEHRDILKVATNVEELIAYLR